MIEQYAYRLTQAMQRRNVDVTTLAKALGMTYQGVKRVVEGKSKAFTAANNEEAAHFLRISPRWLATGKGDMETGATRPAPPWPLPFVDEAEVRSLSEEQLTALGVVVSLAMGQLKTGIKITPSSAPSSATTDQSPPPQWPLTAVTPEQWALLTAENKARINGYAEALVIKDGSKIEHSFKKLA